ncbi:MAG: hypothetical protein ACYTBJ_17605, partial [Planctomycetota bacterium]
KQLREEVLQQTIKGIGTEEDLEKRKLFVSFQASQEKIKQLVKDDTRLKTILALNEKKFQNDLNAIETRFDKIADDKRKALIEKEKKTALEIELIDEQLQLAKLDNTKENEAKRLAIEKRILDVRIKQIENARDQELKNAELTAQERIAIEKKAEKEILEAKNEARAKDKQAQTEANKTREEQQQALKEALISLAFDTAQQIADISFSIAQENADRESEKIISEIERRNTFELDQINRKVEAGLITQKQADRLAEKQEKENNKALEREAKRKFEEDKKRQKAQAIINGALAFTNALATTQPLVPLGLITGAGVLISTGLQVAKIESTQFAKGGILKGPSHSQGGIRTPYGELEGGEAVINKRSTKMFKPLLSKINQAGGGVKFAQGGILGSTTPQTATGNSDLTNILERLNENIQKPVRSYVVETDVTDTQNRVQDLENNASL